MRACTVISHSSDFKEPQGSCVYIVDCTFNSLAGCVKLTSLDVLKVGRVLFTNILGEIPFAADNIKKVEIKNTCFARCEFAVANLDGAIWIVRCTELLVVTRLSFFGCCTSFYSNTGQYIFDASSPDFSLSQSNSSFNRAMRGTGVLIGNSVITKYSNCIYASGFSKSTAVFLSNVKRTSFVSDLIFVHNIHIENDYHRQAIFVYRYNDNVDVTLSDSYFVENQTPVVFYTSESEGSIISKGNLFSSSYDSITNIGKVLMKENENQFIADLKRTHPIGFDQQFVCRVENRITRKSYKRMRGITMCINLILELKT